MSHNVLYCSKTINNMLWSDAELEFDLLIVFLVYKLIIVHAKATELSLLLS